MFMAAQSVSVRSEGRLFAAAREASCTLPLMEYSIRSRGIGRLGLDYLIPYLSRGWCVL